MYADGGPVSREIQLLSYIDRFGVQAVLGRPTLGAGEIKRMLAAERIVAAYRSRAKSDDWADWADKNKRASNLLNEAMLLAGDYGGR